MFVNPPRQKESIEARDAHIRTQTQEGTACKSLNCCMAIATPARPISSRAPRVAKFGRARAQNLPASPSINHQASASARPKPFDCQPCHQKMCRKILRGTRRPARSSKGIAYTPLTALAHSHHIRRGGDKITADVASLANGLGNFSILARKLHRGV